MKNEKIDGFEIILKPGQILYLPKHWFHSVQTISDVAISVNQWVDVQSDKKDHLSESLARFLVMSIKFAEGNYKFTFWNARKCVKRLSVRIKVILFFR